jgi:hypothetical protein
MVAWALEHDRCFGILYHDPDRFGPFERNPGRVGTMARIGEFRPLPDGRSLLLAHGEERFRIVDGIEGETPYLEALVEGFEDREPGEGMPGADFSDAREDARVRRRRATLALLEMTVGRGCPDPTDGEDGVGRDRMLAEVTSIDPTSDISFRVAGMIRTDPFWQHGILSLETEVDRLDRIDELLRMALRQAPPSASS